MPFVRRLVCSETNAVEVRGTDKRMLEDLSYDVSRWVEDVLQQMTLTASQNSNRRVWSDNM